MAFKPLARNRTSTNGKPTAPNGRRAEVARAYDIAGIEPAPVAFQAKAEGGELVLEMMDVIGPDWFGEGITARAVQASLTPETKQIRLRINSPGGDATEGTAIRSILRAHAEEHGAKITAEIHGLAASAATVIAMAADEIVMGADALFMVHEAWSFAMGEADDLRQTADVLDKINGVMASTYAKRTGKKNAEVREIMAAETWMSAEEAVADGFADSIMEAEGSADAEACTSPRVFAALYQFRHTPLTAINRYGSEDGARLVVALATDDNLPVAEQAEPQQRDKPVNAQALALLGLKVGASEDEILNAVAALKLDRDDAKTLAKEYQGEVADLKSQIVADKAETVNADVAHRIETCKTQGKVTPAEADALTAKFAKRSERGALAVELFLEDLKEIEDKDPLPMTKDLGLDGKAPPTSGEHVTEITPAMRELYGPDVTDEQILKTERSAAKEKREQKGN